MTDIRLAPSGRPIKNASGGKLDFGPGACLEELGFNTNIEDDTNLVVGTEKDLGHQSSDILSVSFAAPGNGYGYTVRAGVDVINQGTDEALIAMIIQSRIDGVNWVEQARWQHKVAKEQAATGQGALRCVVGMLRTLLNPATVADAVEFRARILLISGANAEAFPNAPPNTGDPAVAGNSSITACRVF